MTTARRFDSLDLIRLPRLDSHSAQTLGTEVLAAARDQQLSAGVAEALEQLSDAHRALHTAVTEAATSTTGVDVARTHLADAALDASWAALFDLLSGWSKLAQHANAGLADELLAQIFPEGLRFVQLAYKLEWAESNARLTLIAERKLDVKLAKLSATPILECLHDAHRNYGEVLGITDSQASASASYGHAATSARGAFDEFTATLRHYIVCVAASVRKNDAHNAAVADALLAPVRRSLSPAGVATKRKA